MRYRNLGWTIARILFGAFFIYAPIMILIEFGGQNPPETVPAAQHFAQALNDTGFINPALIVDLLIGGVLMLFHRTAPVGLILLAPPILVITGFHWFLSHQYVWGSIWPIWWALLAWRYRHVFARLVERPRR
ncbi:hypothetical protein [Sphingomonas sp. GB1N7]|uniref:hypothetical protein n=1 Tax=Parasphingomonas caseinilytica TaxID=3096158 RepID=UPI002FCC3301